MPSCIRRVVNWQEGGIISMFAKSDIYWSLICLVLNLLLCNHILFTQFSTKCILSIFIFLTVSQILLQTYIKCVHETNNNTPLLATMFKCLTPGNYFAHFSIFITLHILTRRVFDEFVWQQQEMASHEGFKQRKYDQKTCKKKEVGIS